MLIFKNCNGNQYEVHALCGFNKADAAYYAEETHRLCAYALLQDLHGNCVVACGLNTMDWNHGVYFYKEQGELDAEVLEKARAEYEKKVEEYTK